MNNSQLIASVKLLGAVPENQLQFSDDNILLLCTEELHERIGPFLTALNSDYLVHDYTFQTVADQRDYRLPRACAYGGIRDIFDAGGRSLIPIDPTSIKTRNYGKPHFFFFTGQKLSFYPTPTYQADLTLRCLTRMPTLTPITNHAVITAIDPVLKQLSFSLVPTSFVAGTFIDIQKPTGSFEIAQIANKILSATTTDILLESDISPDVAVGDYVCLEATAAFPPIPEDLHSTLALCGASRCLLSLGWMDQMAVVDKKIDTNFARLKNVMWPRSKGETEKVVSILL